MKRCSDVHLRVSSNNAKLTGVKRCSGVHLRVSSNNAKLTKK